MGGEGDNNPEPEPEPITQLKTGKEVNVAFKELAGNSGASYNTVDTNIESIIMSDELDEFASYVDIALDDSEYPVYAWYDNNDTIYYWSEADKIYLNEDSSYMFYEFLKLESLDISSLDTSKVTDMSYMFYSCEVLNSLLDISNFDTGNVTNINSIFGYCKSLTSLDVSNWNTSNVTSMYCMFDHCYDLTSLDVSNFDTRKVTNMGYMFRGCQSLTSLDVSNFNTSNVIAMFGMFQECYEIITIYSNDDNFVTTGAISNSSNMFIYSSKLIGGNGTIYNEDKTDASMAHIDTSSNPGYFTDPSKYVAG